MLAGRYKLMYLTAQVGYVRGQMFHSTQADDLPSFFQKREGRGRTGDVNFPWVGERGRRVVVEVCGKGKDTLVPG